MSKCKKSLAVLLSCVVMLAMFAVPVSVSAAANPKLNKTKVTVTRTKSVKLTLKNATASNVKWSTSNKAIATVSKGKVTGKKAGTATITAKYNGKSYKCKVTVKGKVINKKNVFNVFKSETIKVQLKSSSGAVLKVKSWKSSNTKIATISSKGIVTGKKAGTATIIATDTLGDQYKAKVKVSDQYLALKNYLVKYGKVDDNGNPYIVQGYEVAETDYEAFITYIKSEKKFEFYTQNSYGDIVYIIEMYIPYGGTHKTPVVYFTVDTSDDSLWFEAQANVNIDSYSSDTRLNFDLLRGSVDNSKLQSWANNDFLASLICWDDMINEAIGATINTFGFKKL